MKPGALALALALAAVLLIAWFGSLAVRPLYKPDEARYGEIAREMVQSGDWVTPRLNGFRYLEKPPLQYWASAAALGIFGVRDWAARLWTALLALAGVLLAGYAGNRLFAPPAGVLAGAVLASSPLYLLLGQLTTLDMGVSFFLSLSVFAFAGAQREEASARTRLAGMLVFWAGCALATLSKGLIGIVLPAASVGAYVVLRRDWRLLGRLHLAAGLALYLAIASPWFVAVSVRNPEFAHFFFVQEHFQRFTTHMHHREHPFWYFVPVLAAGMAPWIVAASASWFAALRRPARGRFSPRFFLGLWALVVFGFFSASGSKLPPYILPLLPALAVLTGDWLARCRAQRLVLAQCVLTAVVGVLLGIGLSWLDSVAGAARAGLVGQYRPWLALAAVILGLGGAAAAVLAVLERRGALFALALAGFAATLVAIDGHRTLASANSIEPMTAALPSPLPPDTRLYAVATYDHSMPWALRRTVTLVAYKGELAAGIDWEPARFIPDLEGFRRAWAAPGPAYAFFALRDFDELQAQLALPLRVLARGPHYVLTAKP